MYSRATESGADRLHRSGGGSNVLAEDGWLKDVGVPNTDVLVSSIVFGLIILRRDDLMVAGVIGLIGLLSSSYRSAGGLNIGLSMFCRSSVGCCRVTTDSRPCCGSTFGVR